jgi:hypothetical protein
VRRASAILTPLLLLPIAAAVTSPVSATTRTTAALAVSPADFNGDGNADLVVGAPGESFSGLTGAGAVSVRVSGKGWQQFTQDSAAAGGTAESGDHFGASFAAGDFNGDSFTDLAVGAPTEDVGSVTDAGVVNVLYGSANGLTSAGGQVFTQNSPGVGSSAERGDLFGFALTAGDFDDDGRADLAVGVRGEDGSATDTGAVNVLRGSATGLRGSGSQLFTQNNAGAGHARAGDLFGSALASGDFDADGFVDLAVGVPHEDVGSHGDAGAVNVLRGTAQGLTGTGGRLLTEDSPGVAGGAEAGDAFGTALATGQLDNDSFADLAVGVPLEDVGTAVNAGAVHLFHGSAAGLVPAHSDLFTQNSTGFADSAEAGDLFGYALVAVDFFDVGDTLAIGVPGEDVGAARNAGAVQISKALYTESSLGVGGGSHTGEHLGASLADIASAPAAVAVGAPGEDHGTGAVLVVTGSLDDGNQLPPSGQMLRQPAPGSPEPGDFFGTAVAGS